MTVLITGAGIVGTLAAKKLMDMGERPVLYEIAPQIANIASYVDINKIRLVRGDILDLGDLLRAIKSEGRRQDYPHCWFSDSCCSREALRWRQD